MIRVKLRTKILATLGPATADEITLKRIMDAGVQCVRLNFSHGSFEDHAKMLAMVRAAAKELKREIAVLGDLCGPKIRVGEVSDIDGTGGIPIVDGDQLIIRRGEDLVGHIDEDGNKIIGTIYPHFVDDVSEGDRVLIEDGLLRFEAVKKTKDEIICDCRAGGLILSRKGINLPDSPIQINAVTKKDLACVDWAIENKIDFLALSFVRSPDDLKFLRHYMIARDAVLPLIAKIEKPQALDVIDEIIEESDGLMIARGDLGVEMDLAEVPVIQKDLVKRCTQACKPVIVATQMLQSMVDNYTPTRAEATDVANAIFEGADAVMLSGETSVGKHPVVVVRTMAHIAMKAEAYNIQQLRENAFPVEKLSPYPPFTSIAEGIIGMVRDLPIVGIACCYSPEQFARILSKLHCPVPVYAMAEDDVTLRRMGIYYGVVPLKMRHPDDHNEVFIKVNHTLIDKNFARPGDRILVVGERSDLSLDVSLHTVFDDRDDL